MTIQERYWKLMRAKARELKSDGCSGVSEWKQPCCLEHDVHYRTGMRWKVKIDHLPTGASAYSLVITECLTRREADNTFYSCMKHWSRWWMWWRAGIRWIGVRRLWFPSRAWTKYRAIDGIECEDE